MDCMRDAGNDTLQQQKSRTNPAAIWRTSEHHVTRRHSRRAGRCRRARRNGVRYSIFRAQTHVSALQRQRFDDALWTTVANNRPAASKKCPVPRPRESAATGDVVEYSNPLSNWTGRWNHTEWFTVTAKIRSWPHERPCGDDRVEHRGVRRVDQRGVVQHRSSGMTPRWSSTPGCAAAALVPRMIQAGSLV